jgi:hypothetical protein
MYRQGHGDCFLLAFPPRQGSDPVYVLIDCGFKPGSDHFLSHGKSIQDVVDHLHEATGGRIDLAVITHEHQDHCNGIWKKRDPYFDPFEIHEAWFAWTESPTDALAKQLRKQHRDQLLSLVEARHQLSLTMAADAGPIQSLDSLLAFELGGDEDFAFNRDELFAAAGDPENSVNKQALKLFKDKASVNRGVKYLSPGDAPLPLPGCDGVNVYVLGPPRSSTLLGDEDPQGEEEFSRNGSGAHQFGFSAAALSRGSGGSPFRREYHVPISAANDSSSFFGQHYGSILQGAGSSLAEAASDAPWRRIDTDWLFSAEDFALKLNTGINNTSLVLAFELPNTGKVLLFAADAQRGNWISWHKCKWADGSTDRVRDLLKRTVLYKVGHHGSHNATLNGDIDSEHANLSWMGLKFPEEFTAMITAVNEWALTKNRPPWHHPLESIRRALDAKAQGRVFQTDQDAMDKPDAVSNAEWSRFLKRTDLSDPICFDYTVLDQA